MGGAGLATTPTVPHIFLGTIFNIIHVYHIGVITLLGIVTE
jgi:hypothetical protein